MTTCNIWIHLGYSFPASSRVLMFSEWPHKSSLTRCRRTAWKPWIETSWPLHQRSISCSWSTPPSPFREASTSFPDFQIIFQIIFQITQLYGSIMQHETAHRMNRMSQLEDPEKPEKSTTQSHAPPQRAHISGEGEIPGEFFTRYHSFI